MSHTPGPWFAELDLEPMGGRLARAVMAQDAFVAYALYDDEDDDRAAANAHLIAAAPDLLKALEAVGLAQHIDNKSNWFRATELTNAALAKARGEQS
jgi:hypothetical protein